MSFPAHLTRALASRFAVHGLIGHGASGWVVHAHDPRLGRDVALKVARQKGTPKQLARFQREGLIAGKLQHPNVVRTHDLGEVEGHPYLVLELVAGARTLRDVLERDPVPARLRCLADAIGAMAYAHGQGVVHRDLKPENVLVDGEGRALVTDFGVATLRGLERMTQTGALVGTPQYMAPEQLGADREHVGAHSDVWALGVMLYEAVYGARPFLGNTLFELASQVSAGPPQGELLRGAPPAIRGVIERALAYRPAKRLPHAAALERLLGEAREGRAPKGPRRAVLAWSIVGLLAAGAAISVLVGVLRATPSSSSLPKEAGEPALRDAGQVWASIREQERLARLPLSEAWLVDYPGHPRTAEVQQALEEDRLAGPRWIHADEGGALRLASLPGRLASVGQNGKLTIRPWGVEQALSISFLDPGAPAIVGCPTREAFWLAGRLKGKGVVLQITDPGKPGTLNYFGKPIKRLPSCLAWSADGSLLAWSSGKRTAFVRCEDLLAEGDSVITRGGMVQHYPTVGIAFFDDGSGLAAVSGTGSMEALDQLVVLKLEDRSLLCKVDLPVTPTVLAPLPGAQVLVGSESGHLLTFDPRGTFLGAFKDPALENSGPVSQVADVYAGRGQAGPLVGFGLSPGGRLYTVGRVQDEELSEIRVWDLTSKQLLRVQRVKRLYSTCCVSSDGRYLACATEEGEVDVWDRWVPDEWSSQ